MKRGVPKNRVLGGSKDAFEWQASVLKASATAKLADALAKGEICVEDIPGAETAKRAMEIAAVGGHSIALVSRCADSDLICRCLCSAFALLMSGAASVTEPAMAEMMVVVWVNDADFVLPTPAETGRAISARVEAARARSAPEHADAAAISLLKEAEARMPLGPKGKEAVMSVAASIAKMDGATLIRRAHVAESLAYRYSVQGVL